MAQQKTVTGSKAWSVRCYLTKRSLLVEWNTHLVLLNSVQLQIEYTQFQFAHSPNGVILSNVDWNDGSGYSGYMEADVVVAYKVQGDRRDVSERRRTRDRG